MWSKLNLLDYIPKAVEWSEPAFRRSKHATARVLRAIAKKRKKRG